MKSTTRSLRKFGCVAVLIGSAGSAVWAAAIMDTPRPTTLNPALALKEPYKVLEVRSIFSRDGRAAPVVMGGHKPLWPSRPAPTTGPDTRPVVVATPDPESSYVLRGVGIQEGVFTAVFEQTSENKGYVKHIGDSVARGQIMAMSLDGVDYSLKGKASRILIGQTLEGKAADVVHSAVATGGSGDRVSRWIHHDTPAAVPGAGPAAEERGNEGKSRSPWGQKEKNRFEGSQGREPESNDRQGDRQGDRQDRQNERQPDNRPADPGPNIPDDLPIIPIIIDPN